MKYVITLFGIILCGCVSRHTHTLSVHAKVEAFHPQAMHEDFEDGGWATYDAVVFKILSPVEWEGTNLTIYCHPEDTNVIFKTVGDVFQFRIEEDLLGAGPGSLFDGAIQQPKRINGSNNGTR
jgi:hypothetical protein